MTRRSSLRRAGLTAVAIAAVSVLVAACKSASTAAGGPDPVKCELTLAGPATVVAEGGTGTVSITAQPECAWTAATEANWISELVPASGQGNGALTFRAAPNPAASRRDGNIVVNDSRLRVSQDPAPCQFEISPTTESVPASGTSGTITIAGQLGCAWTATSGASWITITSNASGNGNGTVSYSVAANNSEGSRSGTMAIANRTFTVNQAGVASTPCTFTIDVTSQQIAATGGAGIPVVVTAPVGCAWTAASNVQWITMTSGATGNGNGLIIFTVAANTGVARTGTLTIAGRTSTVTQAAAAPAPACTYAIDPMSASAPAGGATGSVAVTTGSACAWTASSNAAWITVTSASGGGGTGNGTVTYSVAANTGTARTGSITIAGQTFTVTQAAAIAVCTYSVSNTTLSVPAIGGTHSVEVTTGSGCSWTATRNAGWIDIVSGASGTGSGTVVFVVSSFNGMERSGTLTVAGQSVTVNQSR
jgi:Putative binding domain, N-terminal